MSGMERPRRTRSRRSPPRRSAARGAETDWDRVATWYDGWVGPSGSDYHREIAVPAVLDLLEPRSGEELLDVGCGQGVLAPYLTERGVRYTGVDGSPRLIAAARRRHPGVGRFLVADARELAGVRGLASATFDAAVFLLSIQDMDPLDAVLSATAWALRPSARIVVFMTHPAFRIPRHSGWGVDEGRKLQYRRVDSYLTPMAVPMKSLGGGPPTRSFHRPLSAYVEGFAAHGFAVDRFVELPDLPPERRPGRAARAGDRARAEIPLFLALRASR
jgi:SAM-dependent methyltransferase